MNGRMLAQIQNPVIPWATGGTDEGVTAFGNLIGALTGAILIFAFILAFFYLIIGGISWVTSQGDKGALEKARNQITHAIIGLVIVAAVWALMTLVGAFLGINFPELPFPTIDTVGG
jgi:hypothetical protein